MANQDKAEVEALADQIEADISELWEDVVNLETDLWALAIVCRDYLTDEG